MEAPQSHSEHFAVLDGEPPPLVPPGEYLLRFDHFETAVMFGRAPKLVLAFTIISFGEFFEVVKPGGEETEVAVSRTAHRPGALGRASAKLGEKGINIDYSYCGLEPGAANPLMVFGVDNVPVASAALDDLAAAGD